MIELQNITVTLPHGRSQASTILRDISLTVADGEWIVIVGANGCGKTTLLKTIADLIPLASGHIHITGKTGVPPRRALLLQEPDNQFVSSSVRSELLLSLPPAIADEERSQRLAYAIEQFSLADLLHRNPHRISGGEKQRLAFATVWLSDPELLLLDEPTSYLDNVERERCVSFVKELHRDGVSIVWAAPRVSDLPYSGRVVHLVEGTVDFDGTADAFRSRVKDSRKARETKLTNKNAADSKSTNAHSVVSLRSVSFSYDDRCVFDGISAELVEGECVGISGRNGSGKSTLLALLSGVLEPSAGSVVRLYKRASEHGRQNTFYLFQSPERLFFAETVFEEIAFGLRSLKIPKAQIRERVERALVWAGLAPEDFADRLPFSLSLGEMRRLAFAIASALEPRFLLLDEPASCLDDSGQAILLELLQRFKSDGRTIAVASHDTNTYANVVDRVIEL